MELEKAQVEGASGTRPLFFFLSGRPCLKDKPCAFINAQIEHQEKLSMTKASALLKSYPTLLPVVPYEEKLKKKLGFLYSRMGFQLQSSARLEDSQGMPRALKLTYGQDKATVEVEVGLVPAPLWRRWFSKQYVMTTKTGPASIQGSSWHVSYLGMGQVSAVLKALAQAHSNLPLVAQARAKEPHPLHVLNRAERRANARAQKKPSKPSAMRKRNVEKT